MEPASTLIDVGRITAVFGVKGWVKVHSATEPADNIFSYNPWRLKTRHGVRTVEIDASKAHGTGFVVHIKGVDDRTQAEAYVRASIAVDKSQLAPLEDGDYYWHQLQGLRVVTEVEGHSVCLGCVNHLLETGANDVLVVQGGADSHDDRERLIPFVPGQFVQSVDLQAGIIRVDWDPEF